ncbi:unnamed protein product, partial [Iphiclides podalirius]
MVSGDCPALEDSSARGDHGGANAIYRPAGGAIGRRTMRHCSEAGICGELSRSSGHLYAFSRRTIPRSHEHAAMPHTSQYLPHTLRPLHALGDIESFIDGLNCKDFLSLRKLEDHEQRGLMLRPESDFCSFS